MSDEGSTRWGRYWRITGTTAAVGAIVATKMSLTEKGLVVLSATKVKPPEPPSGGGDAGVSGGQSGEAPGAFDDVSRFISDHGPDALLGGVLGALLATVVIALVSLRPQNGQAAHA